MLKRAVLLKGIAVSSLISSSSKFYSPLYCFKGYCNKKTDPPTVLNTNAMSAKDQTNAEVQLSAEEKEKLKKEKKKQKEDEKAAKIAKAKEKAAAAEKIKQQQQQEQTKPEEKKKKKKEGQEDQPFVNTTVPGEKKDMSQPIRNSYDPTAVETSWYDWWLKKEFFKADNKSTKEKFVMVIPPPNVTGSLHLGHALTNSVEDTITRWHRMHGRTALWVPGTDHAGIATQVVVEKKLAKERKISRHDLGREKFVEEVWKWKNEYGGRIVNQLKRLGSSLDWTREAFTMDQKLSRAVTEAFVRFHEKGLIYRETRLVNWCCKLNTAISDIEVEHVSLEKRTKMKVPGHDKEYDFGFLLEFAYKVDGSDEEIVVATTRPETMLGDTAVAVHKNDPRWKHLHGKYLIHPFMNRKIPIVTDTEPMVIMEFGTGAVKVTPAHDHNDYQCGKRHNLQFINIMNEDGTLNDNAGPFKGMKRFDARVAVIEALKEKKLYRGIKDNAMTLAICSRSKDVIEPLLKPQWWVNCKEMAAKAIHAAKTGELEIIPPNHKETWFRWLENIHDWCISRQLWWGHRCPAYLVEIEGQPKPEGSLNENWVVGRSQEEAIQNARKKHPSVDPSKIKLHQDPDVLDTWFSSGIFPFSVLGWPDNTDDMKAFYPTSLLETGHDILFFWVARMVMMGIELTGKLPFTQVFLHAMVRDAHGRKMSKSLGNVIDPVWMIEGISLEKLHQTLLEGNLDPREVEKAKEGQKSDYPNGIPECGTDATRFALCAYTSQGRDINLDVNRVAAYRNFCNKLWNATKFALMNLGSDFKPASKQPVSGESIWEQWILSRLNAAIKLTNEGFKKYDFAQATTAIYNFWLYDFCDVFLESTKPTMQADAKDPVVAKRQNSARETLLTCLDNGLRLISPFMPFVSEELYQRIPHRESLNFESICIAQYPAEINGWSSEAAEKEIKFAQDVIKGIRSLRASFGLTKEKPQVSVNVKSNDLFDILTKTKDVISFLTHSSDVVPVLNIGAQPEGCAVEIISESCQVYMLIKGLVDINIEIEKLEKKKGKIQGDYDKLLKQTQNPQYHKVPQSLKEENQKKLESYQEEIKIALKSIENYKKFL